MRKMDRGESVFPYRYSELFGFPIYLCYNAVIVSREAVMMKKKSILAIGLIAALLFGLTGEAEAFGWGEQQIKPSEAFLVLPPKRNR